MLSSLVNNASCGLHHRPRDAHHSRQTPRLFAASNAGADCDLVCATARRAVLSAGVLAPLTAWQHTVPYKSHALDLYDYINRVFPAPPQPVLYPRKQLSLPFAVLLMRSSYEAVDALDFIAMDSFQVKFWKFRQSQQEGYALQYAPALQVRRGDLTDPLYFDFINFSQWAVIGQEMPNGQQVFKEFCEECEGQRQVVRRDSALADNSLLPARFEERVGDALYRGLRDGFRGEVFGAPPALPASASLDEVGSKVQQLLDIMVARGYALKAFVAGLDPLTSTDNPTLTPGAARLRVAASGTVTQWGVANLSFRRSPVVNAYEGLLVESYLRASGRKVDSHTMTYNDTEIDHEWVFSAAV
ncbi:hypothetical protein QJQ45_014960 [Haematococcus lacustris]|nr:hypothetical protein QJQ45_014960 [Haematococcus lacustris]